MTRSLLSLASLLGLAHLSLAFNCAIPPIYVDIHKRIVHGTNIFQYGSFIGVGTPAQNQSLWPSLKQNETSVAFFKFCQNSNLTNCEDSTNGNFETTESDTFTRTDSYDTTDNISAGDDSFFGTDILRLYTHYFESDGPTQNNVTSFPVEVVTEGNKSPGVVGMGLESTLLQKLFKDGLVAGRTFSLFIGHGFDRAAGVINGSVTFGGYDVGRFQGEVHNFTMDPRDTYPLEVTVSDIVINDSTGLVRNVSLLDRSRFPDLPEGSNTFNAKLTTDQHPFSFPYEITQNYMDLLAAVETDEPDKSLRLNKPFNGTMTVKLNTGLEITVPSNVMFNNSGLSPVAAREKRDNTSFYLGTAFLGQAYLMVDYDAYKFHIAQAIVEQKYVQPRTFCPKSVPIAYIRPKQSEFMKQGLIGAVIGGVVGGCGFITLLICLFCLWKRRRYIKQQELEENHGKAKFAPFEIDDKGSVESKKKPNVMFWKT
ncbi:acid protease [Patellaria atrata CBS 101060]|uniref:Acid protease n=1 Tax=Patellaria atrata CBS 101060 TaxID=1346257 RepID=A0A9P4SF46_9PEZI|nr:acid protease [Patellaria atrata CBS 101060]